MMVVMTLTVDGVTYTFPVGDKLTVLVGDNMTVVLFTAQLVYMVDSLIHLMIVVTKLCFTATGHGLLVLEL